MAKLKINGDLTIRKTMELGSGHYEYDEDKRKYEYVNDVRIIDERPDYSKISIENVNNENAEIKVTKTNADRIRNMSDEELAYCMIFEIEQFDTTFELIEWLQSESEE